MSSAVQLPENVREFFRRQGKIGAAKRMTVLTPEQRQQIARNAAQQRWAKANKSKTTTKRRKSSR